MPSLVAKVRPFFGAVVLTALMLIAAGVYSAFRMPSGVYPEVTFPRITVVAKVPNLDLTTMDLKVTRPLEEAVATVIGVSEVRSKTVRGGSELSITCSPGTDMHQATELVWNHIGSVRSDLPADLELNVEQMTPSVSPIISVVLTGGDDPSQLRDYAFYQLAPRVKNLPDVLFAEVSGGDVREIEVIARPEELLAHGLSAADLADQISQTSLLQPIGRVANPPLAYQLLIDNQSHTVQQLQDLVVSTQGGRTIRVRDVADVEVLHEDRTQSIGFAQKDAVAVTVFRRLGGNTINISNDLQALLAKDGLSLPVGDPHKGQPRNIQATLVYDQARFVEASVGNVRDAIVVGGVFSVLILLLFLRSWRATLISALAIPTTLAITFLFLYWSGESLNLMSLGGLAVAIGLIIDDTVVVVENIARHLTPGGVADKSAKAADPVDAASKEITGAVIGSTLTTVLVFVPLAFIVGVYGQFFAALSWSLCIAVLVSMVISLTVVPIASARFLAGRPMPEPGRIYRFFAHLYDLLLEFVLRFPWATLTVSLAAVFLGVLLVTGIPNPVPPAAPPAPAKGGQAAAPQARPPLIRGLETGLMPDMDEGAFTLDYLSPAGTTLAENVAKAQQIEKVLSENPDIDSYVRRTGTEMGLYATQTNKGDIQVVLRPAEDDPISLLTKPVRPPKEELEKELKKQGKELDAKAVADIRKKYRRRPIDAVMDEVRGEIQDLFSENQLHVETVQIMQDELDDLSGASKPIEVQLFGTDQTELRRLAQEVADTMEEKGKGRGLQEVNSNVQAGNPDVMVRVRERDAERVGIKPEEASRQMRAMFTGQIAAQAPESSVRITNVRVRYPDALRFGPGRFDPNMALGQWLLLPESKTPPPGVPQGPGRCVPLWAVADVTPQRTPDEQWRDNQQPAAFVTAELNEQEAGLGSVAADIRGWMSQQHLPTGYRWELGGHVLQQQEAFSSLLIVMVTAVLLVYVMLAFQFRSVVLPLVIFMTQPLSIVSGLFALYITNTPLNVSSYMGAILLVGLDMKNGILLVEYIQKLREEGMELKPALLLAGRTRFRPILMTSLAAILGLFPLALGIGPGAQMQQPLAIMVIGGLTANMLFTLRRHPGGLRGDRTSARPQGRGGGRAGAGARGRRRTAFARPRRRWGGRRDERPLRSPDGATSAGPRHRPATPRETPRSEDMNPRFRIPLLAALAVLSAVTAAPAADPTLELVQTIASKGKAGDLDHLALDAKGQRLFLSNKANDTLDVLDLKAGQLLRQIAGQNAVQGVAYAPELNRVYAALGTGGLCNVFNGDSYKIVKTLNFKDDADNVRYDAARGRVYVAHAEKSLAVVDAKTNGVKADVPLPADGEAFVLEAGRPRLYIDCPDASEVAVIDTDKNEVTAHYPVKMGAEFPAIALDEAAHRLYVGCRKGPMVVVMDTETGKELSNAAIPGEIDDLHFDAKRKQLYASCGEGFLVVLRPTDADHVAVVAKVATAAGAKTCQFDADSGRLYVAVPRQEGKDGPEVRVFQVK